LSFKKNAHRKKKKNAFSDVESLKYSGDLKER
jgi:hypothetical protein